MIHMDTPYDVVLREAADSAQYAVAPGMPRAQNAHAAPRHFVAPGGIVDTYWMCPGCHSDVWWEKYRQKTLIRWYGIDLLCIV